MKRSFVILLKILVALVAIAAGLHLIFGPGFFEYRKEDTKLPAEKREILEKERISSMEIVEILSAPEFLGRKTGGKGYEMAALFVEGIYSEIGLIPVFNNKEDSEKGYRQYYKQPYNQLKEPFKFEFTDPRGVTSSPNFGERYIFDPSSDEGKLEEKDIVFVGFGIENEEIGHDDFRGIDIEEKVAVSLFRLPEDFPTSAYEGRVSNMAKKGAKALIYIIEDEKNSEMKDKIFTRWRGAADLSPISLIWVDEDTGDQLLAPSNFNVSEWREDYNIRERSRSFPLDYKARLEINNVREKEARGINIVGSKVFSEDNPYVILSAHLDSLGVFLTGEEFPGANDNASGVGVLLEVINRIEKNEREYPFNILLAVFGGEEDSLKGSRHFVNNLPVDPSKVQDVINLDMVGAGSETLVAQARKEYATSKALVSALEMVSQQNENFEYKKVKPTPRSDHWPFVAREFSSTVIYRPPETKEGAKVPYHTPEDKAAIVDEDYLQESRDVILELLDELEAHVH